MEDRPTAREDVTLPEVDLGHVQLADVIDAGAVQSMMDDFYALTGFPMAIIDMRGEVLVGVGWQDICTQFHRANEASCTHCIESDTILAGDIPAGQTKLYKCRNGLWDMASPIFVGGDRLGNVFTGQFFFDDEPVDLDFFRAQADAYGFDTDAYLAALERAPRISRQTLETGMSFLVKLADTLAKLSYSTIRLARSVAERKAAEAELALAKQQLDAHMYNSPLAVIEFDSEFRVTRWSNEAERLFGWKASEMLGQAIAEMRWVHEDDAAVVAREAAGLADGSRARSVGVNRNYRKDGGIVTCAWYNSAIYDDRGQLVSVLSQILDITEQTTAEEERERYLAGMVRLLEFSTDVLSTAGVHDMLECIAQSARRLVKARFAMAGHDYREGTFALSVTSSDEVDTRFFENESFSVARGAYMQLIEHVGSVRLSDDELRRQPAWVGMPQGHPRLRGLLGASISDSAGKPVGVIMISDKEEGSFTGEDELLLRQLASIASLALQQLQTKKDVESERNRLRQIVEEIPVGVALIDSGGSMLVINRANNEIWGGDVSSAGTSREFSDHPATRNATEEPLELDDWPSQRALANGRPAREVIDVVRLDGESATLRVSAVPIAAKDGSLARVVVITEDMTHELEERRLIEMLNEIGARLTATFDEAEILETLAIMGGRALRAEVATASLHVSGKWCVQCSLGSDRMAAGMEFTDEQWPLTSASLGSTAPIISEDVQGDVLAAGSFAREMGTRSMLVIPLISEGHTVASIGYLYMQRQVAFSAPQLEFASRLMNLATVALEKARTFEREHRIAETLQEAILTPPPAIDALGVSVVYRPASAAANVGGDFYDVFELEDGTVSILVGDVSGKGLEAARLTSVMRDGARAYVLDHKGPAHALARLNGLANLTSPVDSFATAFLVQLDPESGAVSYCGAGHPAAIVVRKDGRIDAFESRATLLGAFADSVFKGDESRLERGDVLVLYTDGVIEARRGRELFGEPRVALALEELRGTPVVDLPERLLDRVLEFSDGRLQDDTIILCVTRT